MSNLPILNAVHNDDSDDQQQQTTNRISSFNSRITSRSIIKRQQFTETRIANNQACDEIHDLQPKYSSNKKTNSHELMQGNYYDRTRLNNPSSPQKNPTEHEQIAISVEDYRDRKKKSTPVYSNETHDRSNSPPFGDTIESIQENVAQSAGKLLEVKKHSTKSTTKSHNQAALHYFPHDDDNQQQSSSTSSECSTDDDSSQHTNEQTKSTVPYERLINDDDDDEQILEQMKKSPIDSSNLVKKTSTQSTNATNDRLNCVSTNGYNSHGSSITTKSSSDNSGSIRTNSGSDNDEESDEEHYNNSSITTTNNSNNNNNKNKNQTTINKNVQQQNSYSYRNRDSNNSTSQFNHSSDEKHLQINRLKQTSTDDPTKQSNNDSNKQTTTTNSSSSQSNRNRSDQNQHSINSRSIRSSKKRKQAQQQDIIRTELIPGHRGDRDVDELVMFIDGDTVPLRSNDTTKLRLTTDSTNNKTSTKKKTRKQMKSTSSLTIVDDHENDFNKTNDEYNSTIESQRNQIEKLKEAMQPINQEIIQIQTDSIINNFNNEILSEPFVTVTHRRRVVKERRPEPPNPTSRSIRYPSSANANEKRRLPHKLPTYSSTIKEETPNPNSHSTAPISTTTHTTPAVAPPSSSHVNTIHDQPIEKQENSPRLSSHSSSSSLSSLLKRQAKPTPPVVFLNKSIDIDLNDVSFGFDLDINPLEQSNNDKQTIISSTIEQQSDENLTEQSIQKYPQRTNNRTSQFYSGTDIRPPTQQPQRTYPTTPQTPYMDSLLFYQQRLTNYPQQLAYINLLRPPYVPPQSQYILLPTTYPTATTNEPEIDVETNQTTNEPVQESVLVYTPQTGPVYVQTTKKPYSTSEYSQQTSIPTNVYPTQFYYPNQLSHMMPSHSSYFQPITSSSLLIESKSEHDELEPNDEYEHSTKTYSHPHQQTSSDIMSNALQLVYSQQRKTAQTDRFNLDDLTAYLAMKWTDTVDHYLQGDSRILYVDEQ